MMPMLNLLRKSFPEAEISFLCTDINHSIVKRLKSIDKVINCGLYSFIEKPSLLYWFLKNIRQEEFDVVIDAEQWSKVNSILSIFFRKKYSIGFYTKNQHKHFIYDSIVHHTRYRHEVENFFALLNPLGIFPSAEDKKLTIDLPETELKFADSFYDENKLKEKYVVCLQPGSGTSGFAREWKDENYIKLGNRLVNYNDNIIVLLTGVRADFDRCEEITKGIGKNTMNIAGKYSMDKDLAIIKKAKVVVCGNTGILHLAVGIGTKTIALHGPNNASIWGGYSKNSVVVQSDIFCSPCLYLGHDFGCKKPICMDRIGVDEVFLKLRSDFLKN